MRLNSAQRILEKNRMIFLVNDKIYTASPNLFVSRSGYLTAFQLSYYVNDLVDPRSQLINDNFSGVMLPKNQEIAFYHYVKQFK